jgi:uncharacterized protein YkwD
MQKGTEAPTQKVPPTMLKFTRRFLTMTLVSATAALVTTFVPVATPANAASVNGVHLNAHEAGMVYYVNQARRANGLAPVRVTAGTTDVARRWAQKMASRRTMSHNPSFGSQVGKAGSPRWTRVTENVGYASACNAKQLFTAYMKSPGHRKNILDRKVRFVGMGSVDKKDPKWGCGVMYNTMNFVDQYSTSYGKSRVTAWNLINY